MASTSSHRGFTLIETVVATGVLVTALAGLAQLFILSMHLTRQAGASGVALAAAQQKLESLRGLAFSYDRGGTPITAPALAPSLASSLERNIDPQVDWLDAAGQELGRSATAAFVRRWRIAPLGGPAPDAIAMEVCVFRAPAVDVDPGAAAACLSAVRTRQP